jgi:hypothetical protein
MLKATLDNGLEVILVEDHSAPVVALNVWVRVGSADERDEQWGMAHVHEHMLFKGTERRGVGEIASTVEGAGGNINAFTSYDMTVYHITMASRDAAVGFDVLADAMQNSTFDAAELAKEEEVVIEEIRRSDDSPDNLISRVLFETAYRTHPYRKEVIGTQASVRSFSREGLIDFYRSWYVPNNMTFIAVGDFDSAVALEQIKKSFANAAAPISRAARAARADRAARAVVPSSSSSHCSVSAGRSPPSRTRHALPGSARHGARQRRQLAPLPRGEGPRAAGPRHHASSYTPLDPGCSWSTRARRGQIDATVVAIAEQVRRIAIWARRDRARARAPTCSRARCTSARRCRARPRSTATSRSWRAASRTRRSTWSACAARHRPTCSASRAST